MNPGQTKTTNLDFAKEVFVEIMSRGPDVRHQGGDELHGDLKLLPTQDDGGEVAVVRVDVEVVAQKNLELIELK